MTCTELGGQLLDYHFGTVTLEARGAIEAHLAVCPGCVGAFFSLKRALETDGGEVPEPSAQSRLKLRRAVSLELARRQAPAPWLWWHRPFAFAAAAGVVLLAMGLTFRIATSPPRVRPPASPTSRAAELF